MKKIKKNSQLFTLIGVLLIFIGIPAIFLWVFSVTVTDKILISVNSKSFAIVCIMVPTAIASYYAGKRAFQHRKNFFRKKLTANRVWEIVKNLPMQIVILCFLLPGLGLLMSLWITGVYTHIFGVYSEPKQLHLINKYSRSAFKGDEYVLVLQKGYRFEVNEHLYQQVSNGDILSFRIKCSALSCVVDEDEISVTPTL